MSPNKRASKRKVKVPNQFDDSILTLAKKRKNQTSIEDLVTGNDATDFNNNIDSEEDASVYCYDGGEKRESKVDPQANEISNDDVVNDTVDNDEDQIIKPFIEASGCECTERSQCIKKCLCKKSDIKCSNKCGCQLKICANQKIILQEDNSNFQFQLNQTKETLSKVEREKAALMENLSNLICYHESQQDQLASTKASLEEQMKLKDDLASEIGCLRGD